VSFKYSVFRVKRNPDAKPFLSVTMKDCDLKTFSAGGPGGQHQNTANTGVRITHRASGAVGEARDNRSQLQNKHAAWRRMAESPKFRIWLNRQLWHQGILPEQRAKEDMALKNLRVEGKENGKWVPLEEDQGRHRS
jgi:protein subunit release factor B